MSQSFLKNSANPSSRTSQAYFPNYRAGSQDTVLSQTIGKGGLTATVVTGLIAGCIYIIPTNPNQPSKDKSTGSSNVTKTNPPNTPNTEAPKSSTTAIAPPPRQVTTIPVAPSSRMPTPAPPTEVATVPSIAQVNMSATSPASERRPAQKLASSTPKSPIAKNVVNKSQPSTQSAQAEHCNPINGHKFCWAIDDTIEIKPFTAAKQAGIVAAAVEQTMAYQVPSDHAGNIAMLEEAIDIDRSMLSQQPSTSVEWVRHSESTGRNHETDGAETLVNLNQTQTAETAGAIQSTEIAIQASRTEEEKHLVSSPPAQPDIAEDNVLNDLPASTVTVAMIHPVEVPNIQQAIVTDDQQYLISLNQAQAVKVWSHQTGDLRYTLPAQPSAFVDINLQNTNQSNEPTLMTTTEDGNQQAWHLASGEPVLESTTDSGESDQVLIR